jgi:hypothetical protein
MLVDEPLEQRLYGNAEPLGLDRDAHFGPREKSRCS